MLRLLLQGKSNKEIASALAIAENTVKNHLKNILEKLHLVELAVERSRLTGVPPDRVSSSIAAAASAGASAQSVIEEVVVTD